MHLAYNLLHDIAIKINVLYCLVIGLQQLGQFNEIASKSELSTEALESLFIRFSGLLFCISISGKRLAD